MRIQKVHAREILDSRGNPTVETDVVLDGGIIGRASVPSGASTGSQEACEMRDGDMHRYAGKGVLRAVDAVRGEINNALEGHVVGDQAAIDKILCQLDGTFNKARLGANAILSVSLACARAYAQAMGQPLFMSLHQDVPFCMPVPMMNILNGGAHADNNLDIQEFMIIPFGATDFPAALQMGTEVFHALRSLLRQKGLSVAVGDEGGFAPHLQSHQEALDLLMQAVQVAGYLPGQDIGFALDAAASEWFHDGRYYLAAESRYHTYASLVDYYTMLVNNYPVISIEDGLHEADFAGWEYMTAALGKTIQIVGDDLFVTNPILLQEGIQHNRANAILIKPNQIGTLTETRDTIQLARAHGYGTIMSHRSGETEDTFIADFAVASGSGQIKTGSLCRTDRTAKYNQLLRIHEMMDAPKYPGRFVFQQLHS